MTTIRRIGPGEEAAVRAAARLFDKLPRDDATRKFLTADGHHLFIAYEQQTPVGMVSGIEMTHPDKGTEMFLYELGVDPAHRARGVGRALVRALGDHARERGCYGMWVLTDDDNLSAIKAYTAAGGTLDERSRMLTWDFTQRAGD